MKNNKEYPSISIKNRYLGCISTALEGAIGLLDNISPNLLSTPLESIFLAYVHGHFDLAFVRATAELSLEIHTLAARAWIAHFAYWSGRRSGKSKVSLQELANSAENARRSANIPSLNLDWVTENARLEMNMGRYTTAIAMLEENLLLNANSPYALHSLFAAYHCLGTCYQATGQYSRVSRFIAEQERIVALLPSKLLEMQTIRRKASILVESEKYKSAEMYLQRQAGVFENSFSPVQSALFLQEILRLALVRGEYSKVKALFARLESHVRLHKLPETILNMDAERCEVEMQVHGNLLALQSKFLLRLKENETHGNHGASAVVHLLIAQIAQRLGRLSSASAHAQACQKLCESLSFGRTRVVCYLVYSSILQKMGNHSAALVTAHQARKFAIKMHLSLLQACAEVQIAALTDEPFPVVEIFQIFSKNDQISIHDLNQHINILTFRTPTVPQLKLLNGASLFTKTDSDNSDFHKFLMALKELSDSGMGYFMHEQGVFVFKSGQKSLLLELKLTHLSLFRLFCDSESQSVTLSDVHRALYPNVEFHSDRHRVRSGMTLKRFSAKVAPAGLKISLKRSTMRYVLTAPTGLVIVGDSMGAKPSLHEGADRQTATLTIRQKEVLDCITREISISSVRLRITLGITRQSLHVLLRPLMVQNLVLKQGSGRATRYRIAS